MLDVTWYAHLHTLLYNVASFGSCCEKFETVQSFEPTFLLFRDRRSVALQCWIRLHSSSNIFGAAHAHYTWFTNSNGLYPSHDALQIPTLLGVIATVCTPLPTQTKNVGSCCVCLRVALLQILKLFFLWPDWRNKESLALESEIQLKESGIQLKIRVRNPSSTDEESAIKNPKRGICRIQDCLGLPFFVRRGELLSGCSLTVMPTKQNKGNAIHSDLIGVNHVIL